MKARGKREARRPWSQNPERLRPERPKYTDQFRPFRAGMFFLSFYQGRRASRLPLAFISRAVGALSAKRHIGNMTVNVLPWPGVLARVIAPPWTSTIHCAMERPRPA